MQARSVLGGRAMVLPRHRRRGFCRVTARLTSQKELVAPSAGTGSLRADRAHPHSARTSPTPLEQAGQR